MSTPIAPPNWKLRARIWIFIMFLLLGGADYLLVKFSLNEFNPAPPLLGVAVMSGLCTKLLLVGMWRRMSWTRYTLGVILVVSITAFSAAMFFVIGGKMTRPDGMVRPGLAGIGLQALVLIPLAKSRSIRRQMHPLTSAGG
ncbi:MAG: hypothetical protein K8R23_15460 [Chthoniobacter sp.]|nr:hypothetical protein [Chthoniobacter sp.]